MGYDGLGGRTKFIQPVSFHQYEVNSGLKKNRFSLNLVWLGLG